MAITRRGFLAGAAAAMPSGLLAAEPAKPWTLPAKRPFSVIENQWIALKDGARLAMRLWLPDGAEASPVPVVLEYLPYRKRDRTRGRDDDWLALFAPYGVAFARVDIRGTGDSDGVL
ncbi:MAG TPA: CocE/NonD family hydrolase, partial [Stellaceae bacterium]|nr:CocE/NonD family hydrolase [Stellaceae bacterium]